MGDPGRSGESIGKEKLKKLSFVEVKGDEENQDDFCEGESVKEEESSMNLNRFEHTDEVKSTESEDQNKWGKEKEKADEDLSDWEFTEQREGNRGPNEKVEEKLEDVVRSTTTENHQVTEEKEDQVDSGVKQVEEEKKEEKKEETDDTVMENDLVKEEEEEQKEEADDRIEENYPAKEEQEEDANDRLLENYLAKEEQEEDANDRLLENCPAKAEEEAREEVDDRLMENYQVKEEEEVQKEEEADKDQNVMSTSDPVNLDNLTTQHPAPMISIEKIATMEKRCDFGLFIHKTDVMVVGGQAENGNFLDDMLKIHVPTGQVCKADGKLAIPLSGMQVESTAIHQSYLVQFFDTTSCFYGE